MNFRDLPSYDVLSIVKIGEIVDRASFELVAIYIYYLRCRDTSLDKKDFGAYYFDVIQGNRRERERDREREKKSGECEPRSK